MPRVLGRLLCWAAVPFLAALAFALGLELWQALRIRWDGAGTLDALRHPAVLAFLGAFAFRLAFRALMARIGREDPLEFIDTLEHELTHALMGYLTLSPPVSLSATLKSGGEVELQGSNPLAALAPYYLPLWCGLAALLGLLIRASSQGAWNALVFGLLGSFAYRLLREFHWRQTDLHLYGFTFSLFAVLTLLLLAVGLILQARGLLGGRWMAAAVPEAWEWLRRAFRAAAALARSGSAPPP